VAAVAGTVPAEAVLSDSDGIRPFDTARYAVVAPATVSSPNVDTARARRGVRRGGRATIAERSRDWPPNVLIPVEVTSGPSAGGSNGRRPMS
jgi:hypothetical protein